MVKQYRFKFYEGEMVVEQPKTSLKEHAIKVIANKNTQITIKAGIVVLTLMTFSIIFNKINSFDLKDKSSTQSIEMKVN